MREKHAVAIVTKMDNGRERRIPLVGRITGLRNPKNNNEIEFVIFAKDRKWHRCFVPEAAIASMVTLETEYKDVAPGDLV